MTTWSKVDHTLKSVHMQHMHAVKDLFLCLNIYLYNYTYIYICLFFRLPSLRGPRDLTLGGIPKKVFAPNIPVRKEKSIIEVWVYKV